MGCRRCFLSILLVASLLLVGSVSPLADTESTVPPCFVGEMEAPPGTHLGVAGAGSAQIDGVEPCSVMHEWQPWRICLDGIACESLNL